MYCLRLPLIKPLISMFWRMNRTLEKTGESFQVSQLWKMG